MYSIYMYNLCFSNLVSLERLATKHSCIPVKETSELYSCSLLKDFQKRVPKHLMSLLVSLVAVNSVATVYIINFVIITRSEERLFIRFNISKKQ